MYQQQAHALMHTWTIALDGAMTAPGEGVGDANIREVVICWALYLLSWWNDCCCWFSRDTLDPTATLCEGGACGLLVAAWSS